MGADAPAGPAGSVPAVDGTGDDDDDVDVGLPLSGPLHPDDRLWRHPSELASAAAPLGADAERSRGPTGRWLPVVLAGTVGALLAAGLLTLTGALEGDTTEPAAVAPSSTLALAVSTPTAGLADLAERLEPSLFAVSGTSPDGRVTRGSGVAIRPDHVLTAARVVADARELQVLVRGTNRRATLVGADPDSDLAVLAVEGGGLVPAAWGEAADLRPGDPAVTVSSPPTSDARSGPTVTAGIVSGVDRTLAYAGTELRGLLQLDRPVPAEGAGGALLDRSGALVGIILPVSFGSGAFGYAVPAEVAKEVSRQLLTRGRVTHTWLGVEGGDRGMNGGAVVQRVKPGSPAARAGLLDGDVVTEVDGEGTPTMAELLAELRLHQPGDTVRLRVLRGEQPVEVLVTLSDRP
jgi:putative serine protease PepD